jgi:hypothetical protein
MVFKRGTFMPEIKEDRMMQCIHYACDLCITSQGALPVNLYLLKWTGKETAPSAAYKGGFVHICNSCHRECILDQIYPIVKMSLEEPEKKLIALH